MAGYFKSLSLIETREGAMPRVDSMSLFCIFSTLGIRSQIDCGIGLSESTFNVFECYCTTLSE